MNYIETYQQVRNRTVELCKPLKIEDYVVQPALVASPPKWHLGHTTWFFEQLILVTYESKYKPFNANYDFIFNSYYESAGEHLLRSNRGFLSRPTVEETLAYRRYVDTAMERFLQQPIDGEVAEILITGLNHEQQHQELLITDLKFNLGNNPLYPIYDSNWKEVAKVGDNELIEIYEGVYEVGFSGDGFCYDNEKERHKVYLESFKISSQLVSNRAYLEFVKADGYQDFRFWHEEGWHWVLNNKVKSPMYWHWVNNEWYEYKLGAGLCKLDLDAPVCHINYYEATAYAQWAQKRLPTEEEWEIASDRFQWGDRWEWTESAYLPYPRFRKPAGALGEYNGKFMVNQMVLRGASEVTPKNHSRKTYRNYFHTDERWQYTGLRLVEK